MLGSMAAAFIIPVGGHHHHRHTVKPLLDLVKQFHSGILGVSASDAVWGDADAEHCVACGGLFLIRPLTAQFGVRWSQCRVDRDARKAISASTTPDVTKLTCTRMSQLSSVSLSGSLPIFIKARSSAIAEIATIDETSLSFSAEKSTLPIQAGRSARSPASNRETKFS